MAVGVREQILGAATRLFEERGVDGFSMRQIAAEIGYSATTIYHHFDDKDALMLAVCEDGFRGFERELGAAVAGAPDAPAALRAACAAYVDWALDHPLHYEVMFIRPRAWAIGSNVPDRADGGRADPPSFQGLIDLAGWAAQAGAVRGEAREVAALLWSAIHGPTSLSISMSDQIQGLDREATRRRAAALIEAVLASLA
ncbi:TetR/AcrR family transcriptional regulator [Demequina phytophila]|uniref:TetR/AcrR family transcriptional regulator n=1 Tax=Demequina phytophila TaxID=1638981 RepID=UPI00078295BB|nr:TetR/AcrR family transcriptional regulator [Demequina phytophila]